MDGLRDLMQYVFTFLHEAIADPAACVSAYEETVRTKGEA